MSNSERTSILCYIVAKRIGEQGSIAVEAEIGKAVSALVKYLSLRTLGSGIEVLTLNDLDSFGEYKPYSMCQSETEFIEKVLSSLGNKMQDVPFDGDDEKYILAFAKMLQEPH